MQEWSDSQVIGQVFLKLAPFLKLYNQYSTQYDDAIHHLQKCRQENPQLQEFLSVCGSALYSNALLTITLGVTCVV
jgi:hypothetical protein